MFLLRVNIADAKHNGEKCAKTKSRIIELAETEICHSVCSPPGKSSENVLLILILFQLTVMLDLGDHGHLALSHVVEATRPGQGSNNFIQTSHIDIFLFIRDKIADASNNGTKCASSRMTPLTETDSCNVVDCPSGNVKKKKKRITTNMII